MNKLEKLLLRHEGLKLKPYRCTAGKLTIGIGRNIEDNGISEDEAFVMLRNDINHSVRELSHAFHWFENLSLVRQDALIDMHINMGLSRLRGFKKMLAAFEQGDYVEARKQALDSKWRRDVGPKRSGDIALMIEHGRYPDHVNH